MQLLMLLVLPLLLLPLLLENEASFSFLFDRIDLTDSILLLFLLVAGELILVPAWHNIVYIYYIQIIWQFILHSYV